MKICTENYIHHCLAELAEVMAVLELALCDSEVPPTEDARFGARRIFWAIRDDLQMLSQLPECNQKMSTNI